MKIGSRTAIRKSHLVSLCVLEQTCCGSACFLNGSTPARARTMYCTTTLTSIAIGCASLALVTRSKSSGRALSTSSPILWRAIVVVRGGKLVSRGCAALGRGGSTLVENVWDFGVPRAWYHFGPVAFSPRCQRSSIAGRTAAHSRFTIRIGMRTRGMSGLFGSAFGGRLCLMTARLVAKVLLCRLVFRFAPP